MESQSFVLTNDVMMQRSTLEDDDIEDDVEDDEEDVEDDDVEDDDEDDEEEGYESGEEPPPTPYTHTHTDYEDSGMHTGAFGLYCDYCVCPFDKTQNPFRLSGVCNCQCSCGNLHKVCRYTCFEDILVVDFISTTYLNNTK